MAFDERFVRDVFETNNLKIKHIKYGGWCGRKKNHFDREHLENLINLKKNFTRERGNYIACILLLP